MPNNKKGFTLIELLVVMGILGILMAVTILVINPAEYLRRARDTQRINDLNSVNSALGIYIANDGVLTTYAGCIIAVDAGTSVSTVAAHACNGGAVTSVPAAGNSRKTTNLGWVKGVNFSTMTGGSPFGSLPVDPSTVAGSKYFYEYASDGTLYELAAYYLESTYYTVTNPVITSDGGLNAHAYEIGTGMSLINAN